MVNTSNRTSIFSDKWEVLFIGKSSPFNDDLDILFSEFGIAFSVINKKCIIIDYEEIKELTNEHIYAIEAHELAHYIAEHYKRDVKEGDEIEADRIAIELLKINGIQKAADYLIDRLLHKGIKYEDIVLSDNIKNDLIQYKINNQRLNN